MELSDGNIIGNALGNIDGLTLGIDVKTGLGYLDWSFDVSNDGKL